MKIRKCAKNRKEREFLDKYGYENYKFIPHDSPEAPTLYKFYSGYNHIVKFPSNGCYDCGIPPG